MPCFGVECAIKFEWDDAKDAAHQRKHGLAFSVALDFPWHRAVLFDRSRSEDAETRCVAVGRLGGQLHTIIFTYRQERTRVISLHRANRQEEKLYAEADIE